MRLRELEVEKERWGQLQAQTTRNTQAHTFPKHNHASADVRVSLDHIFKNYKSLGV